MKNLLILLMITSSFAVFANESNDGYEQAQVSMIMQILNKQSSKPNMAFDVNGYVKMFAIFTKYCDERTICTVDSQCGEGYCGPDLGDPVGGGVFNPTCICP